MKCPTCPIGGDDRRGCLGESVSRLCELARSRADYRRELIRLAATGDGRSAPPNDPGALGDLLDVVSRCPERGAALPHSRQPGCGCFERAECRAGRGVPPGQVTVQDCLACVTASGRGPTAGGAGSA